MQTMKTPSIVKSQILQSDGRAPTGSLGSSVSRILILDLLLMCCLLLAPPIRTVAAEVVDTVTILDSAGKVIFNGNVQDGQTKELLNRYAVPPDAGLQNVTLPITEDSNGKLLSDEFVLTVETGPKSDFLTLSFFSDSDKEPKIPNTLRPFLEETGAEQDATKLLFSGTKKPPITVKFTSDTDKALALPTHDPSTLILFGIAMVGVVGFRFFQGARRSSA